MKRYSLLADVATLDASGDMVIASNQRIGWLEFPVPLSQGSEFFHQDAWYTVISDHACKKVEDDFFDPEPEKRKSTLHLYDEKTLKRQVLQRLEHDFHIEMEVWGLHPGGHKVRIDAIITPKRRTKEWGKNSSSSFGIEFKSSLTESKGSRRGTTAYYAQCYDYTFASFSGYGRVPVLICPKFQVGSEMASFLAQSNIGTLDYDKKQQQLIMELQQTVWSERLGPTRFGKTKNFAKRTGVRSTKIDRPSPLPKVAQDSEYRPDELLI